MSTDEAVTTQGFKVYIKELNIENFKCFQGVFNLKLNEGLNILVGDNEAGKSTILEAVHLVLMGLFNGKYLKHELTQYLFNNKVIDDLPPKKWTQRRDGFSIGPAQKMEVSGGRGKRKKKTIRPRVQDFSGQNGHRRWS